MIDQIRLEVLRAQFLNEIASKKYDKRKTVSVTYKDYKLLFDGCSRLKVIISRETEKPLYVILDRQKAIQHLKDQGNLYNASDLRRSC